MNVGKKKLCDNCFHEIKGEPCENCGYKRSKYKPDIGILPVGTVLNNGYVVGEVLGKGGFGVTYKAFDTRNKRVVAIKEYYPTGIAHRDTWKTVVSVSDQRQKENFASGAEKFYEEAKTVSKFNGNPSIVNVYEIFHANDTVYFSMEYLDGCDLKTFMNNNAGKLSQGQLLYVMEKVTDALLITHSMNVLHRDIAPDNIYILKDGRVKVIDFGAARQVFAEQSQSLSIILKQGFAPLEQYQRKGKQGPWSDIYAIGATMFYCLVGNTPDDATERIDNPDLGTASQYGVDEELWEIIEKCMAVRSENRYQSIVELKAALGALVIKPIPLVIGDNLPLTVAVDNVNNSYEIGETVAVSATTGSVDFSHTNVSFAKAEEEKDNKKIIIISSSVVALLVVIVAVFVILLGGNKSNNVASSNKGKHESSTKEMNVVDDNTTTEQRVEADSSNESTKPIDSNETTEDETTTREQQSTTKEQETTKSQDTTIKVQETTTRKPETTTREQQTTTKVQETTTVPIVIPEETTKSDYVTDMSYTVTMFGETNSGKYTGYIKNGVPNGKGTFIGDIKQSPYVDFQKTSVYYSGEWLNGVANGLGTYATALVGAGTAEEGAYTTINFAVSDWTGYDYAEIYYQCNWVDNMPFGDLVAYNASSGYMGVEGLKLTGYMEDGVWITGPESTSWNYILQLP